MLVLWGLRVCITLLKTKTKTRSLTYEIIIIYSITFHAQTSKQLETDNNDSLLFGNLEDVLRACI